jgi:hypothetical protein
MAYTKTITNAVAVSGTFTLTLSDVENLYTGDTVFIQGTSNDGWSGQHVLTGVNATNKTVTYTQGNTTGNLGTIAGQLAVRPQWVKNSDVQSWLGIEVATANDTAFISTCVLASNDWCFRKREEAGYLYDRAAFFPSDDVHLAAVNYAGAKYRERGAVDSFASFDSFGGAAPTMSMGQILALLGCGRPQVG